MKDEDYQSGRQLANLGSLSEARAYAENVI